MRSKLAEEREFYFRVAKQRQRPVREVARQINIQLFARGVFSSPKVSTALREMHAMAADFLKDSYMLEFLGLPQEHSEADLHQSLLKHLECFLTELVSDFCSSARNFPCKWAGRISRWIYCFINALKEDVSNSKQNAGVLNSCGDPDAAIPGW